MVLAEDPSAERRRGQVDPDDPDYLLVAGGPGRALRCTGHLTQTGERCLRPAEAGGDKCGHHGAGAPQVRRANKRRLAERKAAQKLEDWSYEPVDDPLGVMADMAGRAAALVDVLSSEAAEGKPTQATLEALGAAMDRAHRMARDLASTGFEAQRVRIAERQLDLVAAVVMGVLRRLGQDPDAGAVQEALEATYAELGPGE